MSKTKNAIEETKEPHTNSVEADVEVPDFRLDLTSVREAKLSRCWFGANDKQVEAIYLLPCQRSGDVSSLYESVNKNDDSPKHVWGCVLMRDVSKSDCLVRQGEDFVAAPKGTIVFMFEPKMLRESLAKYAAEKKPIALRADGKKRTKNGMMAWNWRLWPFASVKLDVPPMLLPSADAPLLPEHATATEHAPA